MWLFPLQKYNINLSNYIDLSWQGRFSPKNHNQRVFTKRSFIFTTEAFKVRSHILFNNNNQIMDTY